MQNKKRTFKIVQHTLLIVFTLIMIYPLVWMVSSSLKRAPAFSSTPIH